MTTWISVDSLPWSKLVDDCLAGNETSWMTFVNAIGPPLRELFSRMGRDPETSQDLVQNFFVKLLQDDNRLLRDFDADRGVPFPLYLRVIAVRTCIDWGRTREAKDRTQWLPLEEIETVFGGRDPSEELAAKEALDLVRGMAPRDRVVLELRAGGASYEEIARVVGMSTGGASATISRARIRLREMLEGDPGARSKPETGSVVKETPGSGRTSD